MRHKWAERGWISSITIDRAQDHDQDQEQNGNEAEPHALKERD